MNTVTSFQLVRVCVMVAFFLHICLPYEEYIMRKALDGFEGLVSVGGRPISSLRFAYDTIVLARLATELQDLNNRVKEKSGLFGQLLNVKKTNIIVMI